MRRSAWWAGLPLAALAGCGGGAPATAPTAAAEGRSEPIHRSAFGPVYGSGCPTNGACGCGDAQGLAAEFACQMDHLAANDIPVTVYLFDGSAWSRGSSTPSNTCSGPECCSWSLGDAPVERLAASGVRGLLHFWGGCHEDAQYQRASERLGGQLLGFYLDDGSSDADLEEVSEFMRMAEPGDWECVAKAFQNRQPATSNGGLARWAKVA